MMADSYSSATRLATHLTATRQHTFVGRGAALALFGDALAQDEPPFAVLHVVGPAGVGKSALLHEFARQCATAAIPALQLDGRDIPATPHGFLGALRQLTGAADPLDALPDRIVLLVDSYERLAPIDDWLREEFLPKLPYWAIVVLADSNPRADDWRIDPGWQAVGRVVQLGNLSAAESTAYLQRRNLPLTQHDTVLRLAHGHPRTLALAAEVLLQQSGSRFDQVTESEHVRFLVERFLAGVPSDAHRAALEACCLVREMSEPLLAAMLGLADAQALFAWLQQFAFVGVGPGGILPHTLVRAAIAANLQWHNLPWYQELHLRARRFYLSAFERGQGHAQHDTLLDMIALHENLLAHQAAPGANAAAGWRRTHRDTPASGRSAQSCLATRPARRSRSWFALFPTDPRLP